MFYDGYDQKGACPGRSRGHVRETRFRHNFELAHDVPGTATAQTQWRICNKCHVMFYDGYESKGRCAAVTSTSHKATTSCCRTCARDSGCHRRTPPAADRPT